MITENDFDESGEMTKKVFIVLFAGCLLFIIASSLIGLLEFIPRY